VKNALGVSRVELRPPQDRGVTLFEWSLALIGASIAVAGIVGALMPSGFRLEALLSLVAGAGAGVLVLAIGLLAGVDGLSQRAMERLFFGGSCVGAAAVAGVLLVLWRRTKSERAIVSER
jgi:hypothetical protein